MISSASYLVYICLFFMLFHPSSCDISCERNWQKNSNQLENFLTIKIRSLIDNFKNQISFFQTEKLAKVKTPKIIVVEIII